MIMMMSMMWWCGSGGGSKQQAAAVAVTVAGFCAEGFSGVGVWGWRGVLGCYRRADRKTVGSIWSPRFNLKRATGPKWCEKTNVLDGFLVSATWADMGNPSALTFASDVKFAMRFCGRFKGNDPSTYFFLLFSSFFCVVAVLLCCVNIKMTFNLTTVIQVNWNIIQGRRTEPNRHFSFSFPFKYSNGTDIFGSLDIWTWILRRFVRLGFSGF